MDSNTLSAKHSNAATTAQTTQQHINQATDLSIESVDQLQPTHKELGKTLQHYREVASTHQPQLKVDTEKLFVLKGTRGTD